MVFSMTQSISKEPFCAVAVSYPPVRQYMMTDCCNNRKKERDGAWDVNW